MDGQVESYKKNTLRLLVDMFNKGYQMGQETPKNARKINVVEVGHDDETMHSPAIEFTRLDDGTIHNYGRSMPF